MSTHDYHAASGHMASMKKSPSHEGYSSNSDSKKTSSPAGAKRRPSRAGTRSVTTLTAAQLERKRANDREAQRAIRQRTKDHIESLERRIAELSQQQDSSSSSKLMELMRRNEELEQENDMLRTRLSHAVAALGCADQNGDLAFSLATGGKEKQPPFRHLISESEKIIRRTHRAHIHTHTHTHTHKCNNTQNPANSFLRTAPLDNTTLLSTPGSAPSPTDRIQILSQPRPASTTGLRSGQQQQQQPPVSQPQDQQQWQQQPQQQQPHQQQNQHPYPSVSSPLEPPGPPSLTDPTADRWSPHPHSHHHNPAPISDPSALHTPSNEHLPYSYVLDANGRPVPYALDTQPLVSQSMPMQGYGTPTSNPSPAPAPHEYAQGRHLTYPAYGGYHGMQGGGVGVSHGGEMGMLGNGAMMGEGGLMYHLGVGPGGNMKVEQH
ncbi:hypothetical protein K432DRAFT_469336 [Lepidopterella palustris CBS 459.81]|uniref:BZIP domain-containing protein n=1 Tax=Lepidopterella palustris CBS 459.81 TaxID=1314670 RepID=A0A8E2J9P4_9PEZI|nr:hypothetical protein K432DRAFT_469336 [Lepidopterella palustris CBS 459.81]